MQAEMQTSGNTIADLFTKIDFCQRNDPARAEYEAAERENRRIAWLNSFYANTMRHNLPMAADTAKLENLDMAGPDAKAFELLKAWRVHDGFGFFIVGPSGCGKSYALQALAKSIMFDDKDFSENERGLYWFSVAKGLDDIRREMNDNGGELKIKITNCDYLFIDDLGAENLTEWAREQIYQVFEHRINFGLCTFITSNCTLDELKARYHERFISRLKEACVFMELKGRDRRSDSMKANIQTLRARI